MNRKGATTIEILILVASGVAASTGWAYSTFMTKDTAQLLRSARDKEFEMVFKRLERVEELQLETLREVRKR